MSIDGEIAGLQNEIRLLRSLLLDVEVEKMPCQRERIASQLLAAIISYDPGDVITTWHQDARIAVTGADALIQALNDSELQRGSQ